MPPIFAAAVRFMPSRTAASDKGRLLWFASFDHEANRRRSIAE
jgi:hypothetical protein